MGLLFSTLNAFNPNSEVAWGAHAPRVLFSAPSRKIANARKSSGCFESVRAQSGWTRGTSSHIRGHAGSPISEFGFKKRNATIHDS